MKVMSRLASALGKRDETPNQELAREIATTRDAEAVAELVQNLSNKSKDVQSDCIKVLYEIGEQTPELISVFTQNFGALLNSKNNRLVWGGMTALDSIAKVDPDGIHDLLPKIITAAEGDSVIARDHAVGILIKLSAKKEFSTECFALLLGQLKKCPSNQFPMYAEMAAPTIDKNRRNEFVRVLKGRLKGLEKDSQRKRVEKLLRRLGS